MSNTRHGGNCCGATHVFSFPHLANDEQRMMWLKSQIQMTRKPLPVEGWVAAGVMVLVLALMWWASHNVMMLGAVILGALLIGALLWMMTRRGQAERTSRSRSHLIEVMLTDYQMTEWAATLKEFGFKLHTRWYNSNSRNYCNLLTYQTRNPRCRPSYTW